MYVFSALRLPTSSLMPYSSRSVGAISRIYTWVNIKNSIIISQIPLDQNRGEGGAAHNNRVRRLINKIRSLYSYTHLNGYVDRAGV